MLRVGRPGSLGSQLDSYLDVMLQDVFSEVTLGSILLNLGGKGLKLLGGSFVKFVSVGIADPPEVGIAHIDCALMGEVGLHANYFDEAMPLRKPLLLRIKNGMP